METSMVHEQECTLENDSTCTITTLDLTTLNKGFEGARINLRRNLALALLAVDVLHRKVTKTMPSDIQGSGLKPDIIAHHPDKHAAQPRTAAP